jgi:hypothetical protein
MSETISGISASSAGYVNGDGLDDLIIGSHWVDLAGNTQVGKSFVVFGKTNTTAINLSDITSGTGGFVINGENPLTSPAEETEAPAPASESAVISLLIAKPPVPDSMVDKLIAFVSFLPNTTKDLPVKPFAT